MSLLASMIKVVNNFSLAKKHTNNLVTIIRIKKMLALNYCFITHILACLVLL